MIVHFYLSDEEFEILRGKYEKVPVFKLCNSLLMSRSVFYRKWHFILEKFYAAACVAKIVEVEQNENEVVCDS